VSLDFKQINPDEDFSDLTHPPQQFVVLIRIVSTLGFGRIAVQFQLFHFL
jgi:hypothetical protein